MIKVLRSLFVALFVFGFINSSFGQGKTIQGVVIDFDSKAPIPFVNISISNVSKGTATDAEGRFKINIAKEKQTTIILSHVNIIEKKFWSLTACFPAI